MSYEVFALKYRPKTFHDVVGQEAVAATLQRAVTSERVAHAFLFCGSRGVGKTSMARILAKALNCPNVKDGEPCNECETCRAISTGDDIDVIEIDGASNRGIDDIRTIRDAAGYVPSRSRYKVYIIDEVHMLTIQAFNALLKVLEEPPPHVKFVFATTDPTSLPDTIVSRCQRHEFKRIGQDDIVKRLRKICTLENVDADEDALRAIASKAEGGLRDSVSLLDQAISYAGQKVTAADLSGALGLMPREHLDRLMRGIAHGDAGAVIAAIKDTAASGLDLQELLSEVIETLHDFMIRHVDPRGAKPGPKAVLFDELAAALHMDRVQYVLRLFLNAKGEIRRAGHERIQIELTALKAARTTALLPMTEVLERLRAGVVVTDPPKGMTYAAATAATTSIGHEPPSAGVAASAPPAMFAPPASSASRVGAPAPAFDAPMRSNAPSAVATATIPPARPTPPPESSPRAADTPRTLKDFINAWSKIVQSVREHSSVIASALNDARPVELEGRRLVLEIPAAKKFHMTTLTGRDAVQWTTEAAQAILGTTIVPTVVAASAEKIDAREASQGVYDDPTVRKVIEHFDGGIINVEKDDG